MTQPIEPDGNDQGKQTSSAPSISLPKGGGAIRGIGEKFAANPVTGTGSMSVPIATSPGRSGFGPQLSLSYDSGAGNGPFGFGWSLSLPQITRKTDKGLPQYFDSVESKESDVFVLSGAEDLVPVFKKNPNGTWVLDPTGNPVVDDKERDGFTVRPYRPRIEGLFARIERWTRVSDADVHWRSISKDNILTLYGKDSNSRIADPVDPRRVFTWLICETRDDKGNAVLYQYKPEDGAGVDLTRAHERNRGDRNDPRRTANRYLKSVHYGNRVSLLDNAGQRPRFLADTVIQDAGWMFEIVFDYGEHAADAPKPDDAAPWTFRSDPFSTYRAGFEVRTGRLCQRGLMFHHFADEPGVGVDCLVRSTDLTYSDEVDPTDARNPVYTFLQAVTQTGYKRNNGGYLKRSLPPVEFEYTQPTVQDTVQEVDSASLENLPMGVDGSVHQWTDLHGEGIPGILTEQAGAWFYQRNLSPISEGPVEFAPLVCVATKPNLALAGGQAQFMDLAGDGQPDLVVLDGPMPGLYEHDGGAGWQPFRPFTSRLNRDMRDPNLKFVDLDGDGHADVLVSEDDAFVWHTSRAEEGFGPARRVHQSLDEAKGPRLVFADGAQSIYLADLSGDGLTDLVRIRNGEVCYWPNLGYGQFGARVTMDHAPYFDNPDQFDQKRVRLADIDGSGTTDIIYLHRDGVRLYFNQSGNSWSASQPLGVFPRVDDLVSIVPTDLLGNGTACLVWSSPLPGDAGRQMRYVDLMGGQKPHLLISTKNNLGAETRVEYVSSIKFYLQDKQDGNPWITRLPFPVHVVERVETYDRVSDNRFVSRYQYHHGYFDGEEREFRGFGMVEQWDTEEFAALTHSGSLAPDGEEGQGEGPTNIDAASHVPPVHTRTWFHTGVYLGRDHVSNYFAGLLGEHDTGEYFREPGLSGTAADAEARALLLPDTVLPDGLTLEEEREACCALKGMMLRQEVYADDAGPGDPPERLQRARTPYTVAEQNFTIQRLQPLPPSPIGWERAGVWADNRHAVFFTHPCEALTYHYERNPADPRIQHALTLEVDAYGNVLKEAAIGYGRRTTIRVVNEQGQVQQVSNPGLAELHAADRTKQTTALLTYTENRVTNAIESPDAHRTPLPCEALTFELTGYTPSGTAGRFQAADLVEPDPAAPGRLRHRFTDQVAYEATATSNPCRRPIEHVRTLYRHDDLIGLLPLGELHQLALPGESYKLAFTPGLLTQVFQRDGQTLLPNPAAVLGGQAGDQGGYLQSQALKADGRFPMSDAGDHWWIPSGRSFFTVDPADPAAGELTEARQHFFLPRRNRDPFGHDAFVDFDPHDLLMVETRDALGNRVTVGEREHVLPDGTVLPAQSGNDYRVLQPWLITDPNRNRTQVAFDALGLVTGTAVMGKPEENLGDSLDGFTPDLNQAQIEEFLAQPRQPHPVNSKKSQAAPIVHELLGNATTRILYDLERFQRTRQEHPGEPDKWEPPFAATIAREIHVSDLAAGQQSELQASLSYSDGFGREIQKKIQAEPGPAPQRDTDGKILVGAGGQPQMTPNPVNPRWVGSGWTIFNNKGKPVRQYEPFFSDTHRFEFGVIVGVSPVLFYDPAERVVATLHPNHTYEKVVFDPWQQTTYDVNDTVLNAGGSTEPTSDEDMTGFFSRLPDSDYLPTWYQQRIALAANDPERVAADKAAVHRQTPAVAHLDTLGRTFLTIAHNRFERNNAIVEEAYPTRVELDIEGNQLKVRDAIVQNGDTLGRIVMSYDYDLLGNRIHQASMEAGERWMLNDIAGQPIRAWDSRGFVRRLTYDELRRPTGLFVRQDGAEREAERTEYGEGQGDARNHRTRVYLVRDGAGVVTSIEYDFKGNLRSSTRELLPEYKVEVDWQQNPAASDRSFTSSTTYDALNRPTAVTAPDASVYRTAYNEANLLNQVEVNLRGAAAATPFVTNIDYDAKGQRTLIDYGNGVRTTYEYDPLTFRLTRLRTTRAPGPNGLASQIFQSSATVQDLRYSYDPAGNITRIEDTALLTIFHNNQQVEPVCDYTYDAVYRLIEANGREHIGQSAHDFAPSNGDFRDYPYAGSDANPNDLQALRNYTEQYEYDAVGNFQFMRHIATGGSWTRGYEYAAASLIEPLTKQSNRLIGTTVGQTAEAYTHDAHGNLTAMPHLTIMQWDFEDQLHATSSQVFNNGTPETTFYVYDAAGQRVRKVTERQNGARKDERIYLGGFEIYREYNGNGAAVMLEREALHVMDDQQRIHLVETKTLENGSSVNAPMPVQRYQLGNHLGSASLELDQDGGLISYEEYHPYGTTAYQAMNSAAEVSLKRYRYTGKERDEETGLYYHGARYYAAWLGRWMSCDPAGIVDGPNLFAYVRGNPVRLKDPSGSAATYNPFLPFGDKVGIEAVEAVETQPSGALGGARPIGELAFRSETDPSVPEAVAEAATGVAQASLKYVPVVQATKRATELVEAAGESIRSGNMIALVEASPLGKLTKAYESLSNVFEKNGTEGVLKAVNPAREVVPSLERAEDAAARGEIREAAREVTTAAQGFVETGLIVAGVTKGLDFRALAADTRGGARVNLANPRITNLEAGPTRQGRRFQTAEDAFDQLEDVQSAFDAGRKGVGPRIESISKSEARAANTAPGATAPKQSVYFAEFFEALGELVRHR